MQGQLDNYPVYCNLCRKKTTSISGTGFIKKSKRHHLISGKCIYCRRGKSSPVGGSIVDTWLKSWNDNAPELVREVHLIQQADNGGTPKKSSFCGPGTQLNKRLENFNPQTGEYTNVITPPINRLDAECKNHDIAYTVSNDKKNRQRADKNLIAVAEEVAKDPNATTVNKLNAKLVASLFRKKIQNDW